MGRVAPVVGAWLLLGFASAASAAPIVYGSRVAFDAATGISVVDTYSGYAAGDHPLDTDPLGNFPGGLFTDSGMTAVLGQTSYFSSGMNNVSPLDPLFGGPGNLAFSSLFNSGFSLGFISTSVGTSEGVYGIGFDFAFPLLFDGVTPSSLEVRVFFNGDVADYSIPFSADPAAPFTFWGVTDERLIRAITVSSNAHLDNLEVAAPPVAVPEPASLFLLGTGAAGLIAHRARRRRRQS